MELKILGSSSDGNCYVFDTGKEALVVECGVSFKDVEKAVDFDISRIVGCLVSHEHADHAKAVEKFIKARIPVYMSGGTIESLEMDAKNRLLATMVDCGVYHIHNFTVQAFAVQHDCAEPFGFLIHHPEMGMVLFATDTYYLAYSFPPLNNILIECNYRLDILERNIATGRVPTITRDRTIKSHMSFDTCRETLLANDLSAVNNIILIHLSDGNSNAVEFQQGIHEATGKTVHVADKGMILKFNKTPF
jgi:phosphoribosyl 1,2-cyclic phosphodiesterase